MDNFFDYIVIIFFIGVAIASIFKKKKKAQEKALANAQSDQQPIQRISQPEAESFPTQGTEPVITEKRKVLDPFEEPDPFGDRTQKEPEYQEEKQSFTFKDLRSEVDKYFEEALLKSQEAESGTLQPDTKSHPKPLARRSSMQSSEDGSPKPQPLTQSDISHTLVKKSAIVDIHLQTKRIKNIRAENIRSKIRNNAELKDMIVISEILGKPKALRK